MTETADDLSAPLGQKTAARGKRRFRLPFTAMQALAVLLGLFLVVFAGFAIFGDNPFGGEPTAHVAIRQKGQGDEKADGEGRLGRPQRCRSRREIGHQTGGQRRAEDRHHHRRLERQAPGRGDRKR